MACSFSFCLSWYANCFLTCSNFIYSSLSFISNPISASGSVTVPSLSLSLPLPPRSSSVRICFSNQWPHPVFIVSLLLPAVTAMLNWWAICSRSAFLHELSATQVGFPINASNVNSMFCVVNKLFHNAKATTKVPAKQVYFLFWTNPQSLCFPGKKTPERQGSQVGKPTKHTTDHKNGQSKLVPCLTG